jgi:hypothetical protein
MSDARAIKYARELVKPPKKLKKVVKLGSRVWKLQARYLREYLKAVRGVPPTDDEVAALVFLWNALGTIPIDAVSSGLSLEELGDYLATILTPIGLLQLQERAELANSVGEAVVIIKRKKGFLERLLPR